MQSTSLDISQQDLYLVPENNDNSELWLVCIANHKTHSSRNYFCYENMQQEQHSEGYMSQEMIRDDYLLQGWKQEKMNERHYLAAKFAYEHTFTPEQLDNTARALSNILGPFEDRGIIGPTKCVLT